MKSTIRHYAPVAMLLAVILAVSAVLSHLAWDGRQDNRPRLLATSYPLYLAAQNVLGGSDEVALEMLSGAGTGCLHDYQLSPSDRLALAKADVVLTNGTGTETFLEEVEPDRLVNTAAGLELLCADHHHEGGEHHEEEYNEHLWVSPLRYQKQVLAVMNVLISLDSENAAVYRENATNYCMGIDAVWSQMPTEGLKGRPCVLFHDSLAYLADDLNLDVKLTLTFDGDSGLAVADLAKVERLAKEHPDLLLIYDTQYPIRYGAVDGLVPAKQVLALDTAVVGAGKTTDWLDAMERNSQKLGQLQMGGDAP